MLLKSFLLCTPLILCCSIVFAQAKLSGKVLSEDGKALTDASVRIFTMPDSTLYAEQKTDQQGSYTLLVDRLGTYTLQFNSLGFAGYSITDLDIMSYQQRSIPTVFLQELLEEIDAVRVLRRMPGIRQYADKMVVDVEGSVLSEGNNLLELLEKTPGILSDGKGNFSIQGRAGAHIRIDGRDTYLSGPQLASVLRGMQASDVAKLELVSNPSAREDASGTAGIINIVTKRTKGSAFGGDVFARGSRSRESQGAIGGGLKYRVNRLSMYVNGSIGREKSSDSTRIERSFHTQGIITYTQRQIERQQLNPGTYHSIRTGASYEFENGGILDASFHWLRGHFINIADVDMTTDYQSELPVSFAQTNNRFDETYSNLTYNINYVNKYDGEDHFLKINLDYAPHVNDYDNSFFTQITSGQESQVRTTARVNVQNLSNTTYAGRLDYSKPLGDAQKLEMGWKGTYFHIDNDVRNDTLQGNNWIFDPGTSNQFQYGQHIEALYLIYSATNDKAEYQLGVRGEYTFIKSKQITLNQIEHQRYFNIFPSGSISYQVHPSHSIRAAFSSRIERPSDHDINAFRVYQDAYSYSEGNPSLKPEKSFISEIGHSFRNKLFTTLSMSYGKDMINWISRAGTLPGENLTRPENVGNYHNYSASVMYNQLLTSWWTANHYVNGFHNSYSGQIEGTNLNSKGSSWSANSRHTFLFNWGLRSEIAAYYNSGVTTGARRSDHAYGLDVSAEKKIMDGKGIIKLSANGVLRNANPIYTSRFGDLILYHSAFPDNRKIMLSLSYQFGQ